MVLFTSSPGSAGMTGQSKTPVMTWSLGPRLCKHRCSGRMIAVTSIPLLGELPSWSGSTGSPAPRGMMTTRVDGSQVTHVISGLPS